MLIPVCINAKNEEHTIEGTLRTLIAATEVCKSKMDISFKLVLMLDDSTDNTALRAQPFTNVEQVRCSGGLVAAQRLFAQRFKSAPYLIFCDGDILIGPDTIWKMANSMETSHVQVAYPEKIALQPSRKSLLARSLYYYNRNNGYQTKRHYFNGQLFAIRNWHIPLPHEIPKPLARDNNYLRLHEGIRCDDIYLSRDILHRFGVESIALVDAKIHYQPPETFRGMYRKYQRMVLEIRRLHHLFPEMVSTHSTHGKRKVVWSQVFEHGLAATLLYIHFLLHLTGCKYLLLLEEFWYKHLTTTECKTWKPILETKQPFSPV
ncbi:glycosyltransferase family 2 protein [Myxococcota bacterium]|nr:glycosyltransferase family 2 protein [Myxococcota bacterium]